MLSLIVASSILILSLSSCSPSRVLTMSCQERHIEIYVDEEYLGRDLVYYSVPKGQEYIDVSCRENGMEIYHRRVYVKNWNGKRDGNLIELQIPKNYRYSNKPY